MSGFERRSWGAVAVLAATAAALAFALLDNGWWLGAEDSARYRVGPQGVELCDPFCVAGALSQLVEGSMWQRVGDSVLVLGGASAVALFVLAALSLFAKGSPLWLTNVAYVAAFGALCAGAWFVASAPPLPALAPGPAMYAFFSGLVVGLVAIHRRPRPSYT